MPISSNLADLWELKCYLKLVDVGNIIFKKGLTFKKANKNKGT